MVRIILMSLTLLVGYMLLPEPAAAGGFCPNGATCTAYPASNPGIVLTTGCAQDNTHCFCPYSTVVGYVITRNGCN